MARRIDSQEFVGDCLTLCPLNWKEWISFASVAADPEIWQRAESIRYSDVTIDRESLGEWIEELTETVATAQTGRPKGTGYAKNDAPLIAEIQRMFDDGTAKSPTEAASMVIGRDGSRATGSGAPESKIKRLVRGAKLPDGE